MSSAFGYETTGTCDDTNVCDCVTTPNTSHTVWSINFKSEDIRQQIETNKNLAEQVRDILYYPFQTPQEAKLALKSILSEDQYKNLKLNEENVSAKMIKDGELDLPVIQKYVDDKIPAVLGTSGTKKLSVLNYKSNLLEALDNAKEKSREQNNDVFNELVSDVLYTSNKSLNDILTKYLMENKLEKPTELQKRTYVAPTIVSYVIDELVKRADKKERAIAKKPTLRKPTRERVPRTRREEFNDNDAAAKSSLTFINLFYPLFAEMQRLFSNFSPF